jgi:hypothetical protein
VKLPSAGSLPVLLPAATLCVIGIVLTQALASAPQAAPVPSRERDGGATGPSRPLLPVPRAAAAEMARNFAATRLDVDSKAVEVVNHAYTEAGQPPRRFHAFKLAATRSGAAGKEAIVLVYVDVATGEALDYDRFGALTATPAPTPTRLLDARELGLVRSLQPGETVSAYFWEVSDARRLFATAAELRLPIEGDPGDPQTTIKVTGPPATVIALVARSGAGEVHLEERLDALRPVAAPLMPWQSIPVPGAPYRSFPLPGVTVRRTGTPLPAVAEQLFLQSAAPLVRTITGSPHDELDITLNCERQGCVAVVSGQFNDSGLNGTSRGDAWAFVAVEATGWRARRDPVRAQALKGGQGEWFTAVPRWIAREAERIARANPVIAARIAGYEWIEGFGWDPDRPGLVRVVYGRPEGLARVPSNGRMTADAGPEEHLVVSVNVLTGLVIGWREHKIGPV